MKNTPKFLNLLKSYFLNRTQSVSLTITDKNKKIKVISNKLNVTQGVFQGSLLGPLFFNIFLNDIFYSLDNSHNENFELTCYADDIVLCTYHADPDQLVTITDQILSNLSFWCQQNNLSINFSKSKYLVINNKNVKPLKLKSPIDQVDSFNYLGLILNSELKWCTHIKTLCSRLQKTCYLFRIIRNALPPEHIKTIFHSYFQSIVRYGVQFWGNDTNAKSVLLLQKRCLRIVLKMKPRESCREVFKKHKIMTVYSMYVFEVCKYIHKHRDESFIQNSDLHHYNTRRRDDVHVGLAHPSVLVMIQIYNKLPSELRALTHTKFEKKLKILLSENVLYSVKEFLYPV